MLLSRYFITVDTSMSGSSPVCLDQPTCFNKYDEVRDVYSLSDRTSAHLGIVCPKSSPASTPEVLTLYPTQCKEELPIPLFQHSQCLYLHLYT